MKRTTFVLKVVVCMMLLGITQQMFAGGAQQEGASDKVKRFSFSTSNAGGTWYTMAGGIATIFNDKLRNQYALDMIASGGSVENTRRLALGEVDMALSYSSHLWEAKNGEGILEGMPSDKCAVMFQIYDSSVYFVALKNTGINKLSDLQGKRVVIGPPGSGSSDNSRKVFEALGISVIESELAFADGARSLQDGQVDALGMSGHPSSGIVELANSKDIIVLPFSDAELDKIVERTPFFTKGAIEANAYKGQTESVPCPYFAVYLACAQNMDTEAVYQAMKVFFSTEGKTYLASVHPQFKPMQQGKIGSDQINVPFHAGALRYFSENP
jgi:TRAP transporter TAXI family solute receptor